MVLKPNWVHVLISVLLSIVACASSFAQEEGPFVLINKSKTSEGHSVAYLDNNTKKLFVIISKDELSLPSRISSIDEVTKGKETHIIDSRDFDLQTENDLKKVDLFLKKYSKKSDFKEQVEKISSFQCPVITSTLGSDPLSQTGNAKELYKLSDKIFDQVALDGDKIIFKALIENQLHAVSVGVSTKGMITSVDLISSPKDEALKVFGPQDNLAYIKKGETFVLKIATENFTKGSGDLVVTVVGPLPSRVEFSESLYKVIFNGEKVIVNPRQLITSEIDTSSENAPSEGVDKRPFALSLQNLAANIIWGGGKEKTYKEIVKAGNEAIKSDPQLIGKYLTKEDIEKIAKRMIDDGIYIKKNAMSEKPKLMGSAYIYFSEELLKKAINEQMPMTDAEIKPIVSHVMENFKTCIANAKYSGGVDDCKNKFAKNAVVKIVRDIMFAQLESNLKSAISGANAEKELEEAKAKAEVEYNRCINKHFTIPFEFAEKNKIAAPDAMNIAPACLYAGFQYALGGVIGSELEKTFKGMNIYQAGDDLLLSSIQKNNSSCYEKIGISIDPLGRRYNIAKMQKLSADDFKNNLIACVNNEIKTGGRLAVERTLKSTPDLQSIFKSSNFTKKQEDDFVSNLLVTGFDRCVSDLESLSAKVQILSPTECTDYITLKAKEAAFSSVLKIELQKIKTTPDPWETEIAPALKKCSDTFFLSYLQRVKKGEKVTEKELTSSCFLDAVASTAFYVGGPLIKSEIISNPSLKDYKLKISDNNLKKYQETLKVCMKKELSTLEKIDQLTAVDPKTKKTGLDLAQDKCTIDVVKVLIPDIVPDILKIEFASVIKDENPANKKKIEAELEKLINPLIKDSLTPLVSKISSMDDLTLKVLPKFTQDATIKAAGTLIDFKLSAFAIGAEGQKSMKKIRETVVTDLKKELVKTNGALTSQVMKNLTNTTMALVAVNVVPDLFGPNQQAIFSALESSIGPSKETSELLSTLKNYLNEAVAFDPSIVDAAKDLQKKLMLDIENQRKRGIAVSFDAKALLEKYSTHPVFKKFILSQLSKQIKTEFTASLEQMEKDELKTIDSDETKEINAVKAKYTKLRELVTTTTTAKSMETLFSSKQGLKTLQTVKDRMILPLIDGKKTSPADMAAITKEVAKTFTESRSNGSFAERFAAYNIQPEISKYSGGVTGALMPLLGYNKKNLDWNVLRTKPGGQKALKYFVESILYPSMTGEKYTLADRKKVLTSYIKEGLKQD